MVLKVHRTINLIRDGEKEGWGGGGGGRAAGGIMEGGGGRG